VTAPAATENWGFSSIFAAYITNPGHKTHDICYTMSWAEGLNMQRYTLYIGLVALLAASPPCLASGKIYQWVDKDGQTHYSDAPQGKQSGVRTQDTEAITIDDSKTNTSKATTSPQQQKKLTQTLEEDRHRREQEAAQKKQQSAEREQRCHQARDRLKRFESSSALYDLDANGQRRILSDVERKAAEEKVHNEIEKYCG